MKNIKYVGHQGDVAIFEIDEFPEAPQVQDELTKNKQLALGELSGHNHYFDNSNAVDLFKIESPEYSGITFVNVKEATELTHGLIKGFKGTEADQDYHSTVMLREGKYITGIVEETDWLTKTVRKVID